MKVVIRCKQHKIPLEGMPTLTWAGPGHWELDLSEMYCPQEPSHHPDEPLNPELHVTEGGEWDD